MAKNKKIFFYIASNLAFLIPVPGRFAYAFILILLFLLQMIAVTLLFHAIYHMKLQNLRNAILVLTIIALGILYRQLLIIICPIAALVLGYCIFLPTLASVIIEFFFLNYHKGVKIHLLSNLKKSSFMTGFSFFFFLLRDIFGYGTFTLPAWKHIAVFHLPYNPESTGAMVFFSTIPGSLFLVVILLSFYIFLLNKFRILKNAPKEALMEGEE